MGEESLDNLKEMISKEKRTINELNSLFNHLRNTEDKEERKMISFQIKSLRESLKKTHNNISEKLGEISLAKQLYAKEDEKKSDIANKPKKKKEYFKEILKNISNEIKRNSRKKDISNLERKTLKRLRKKEKKIVEKKVKKPSKYIKTANKFFLDFSRSIIKKKIFAELEKDILKINFQITPASYISLILFTTFISAIASIFIFIFLLFFNLGVELPIITFVTENIGMRFLKTFWILFAIPIGTFLFMYVYPSLEKRSIENQINYELPFAVIHMSAISNSMLEPSKIFSIIISTKEYPSLEKEFTKIINEINIYGYDLVTALRNIALNTPSKKLADLLNSLATTITSGGDLPLFFDKRAQSLLFDYKLEKEKYSKTAETFMDIYISVVIAAPMILMLLLMMMKISGLGISLSSSMITLIMVLGVSLINIVFLTFLHLKQPKE